MRWCSSVAYALPFGRDDLARQAGARCGRSGGVGPAVGPAIPPNAGIAEIVRMSGISPKPGVQHRAAVGGIALEPGELPVPDAFKEHPADPQRRSDPAALARRVAGGVDVREVPDRSKQLVGGLDLREVAGGGEEMELGPGDGGGEGAAVIGVGDLVGFAP